MGVMKDVVSCDKLRVGAHNCECGDLRMGQTVLIYIKTFLSEYIG